jgi:DNA-binding GntR family transcriptional regulator
MEDETAIGPLIAPVARRNLGDDVYETLRELVTAHRIPLGARLNVDRLARQLNVSPTPVREALARLDADRLVRRDPMRGYAVVEALDGQGFAQLFDMRLLLEPYAAELAASRASAAQVAALHQAVADMRAVPTHPTPDEYRAYSAHDARFHRTLAQAGGNEFLRDAIERLQVHPQTLQLYFRYRRVITSEAADEHDAILAAVRRREPGQAGAAMRAHIISTSERVQQVFAQGQAHE